MSTGTRHFQELVPRRRFSKFRDNGPVSILPLSALATVNSTKISTDLLRPGQYVSTENLLPDFAGLNPSTKLPTGASVTSFQPKDVLVSNIRPYLKKVWQADMTGGVSNDVIVLRAREGVNADYLASLLRSNSFINYVMRGAQGVKMPRGDVSMILNYPVPYPVAEEREAITNLFASLDAAIAAEIGVSTSLNTHKQGMMQQLFPRNGSRVPRIRFPEFRTSGEWQPVAAGQIFLNRNERGDSTLPIYSVTMTDGLAPRASLNRRIENIALHSANKKVLKGDIAYNMMRMWQGALGVAPEDCMVSPAYVVLRPMGVNPTFFSFQLKLPETLATLTAHSRGLTEDRLRLYYDDFARVQLLMPSGPEQDRIVDCLTSVESLIALQGKKVAALLSHKQGLMQQVLPEIEGMQQ